MRYLIAFSFACFCWAGLSYADEENQVALVIGNGQYRPPIRNLDNAELDAERIADRLEEIGFDVQVMYNLSYNDMQTAFKDYVERLSAAGPEATGVFYYAGHGVQGAGSNFLLPTSARAPSIPQDLFTSAPTLQALVKQVDGVGNPASFFIIDACRDSPFSNESWDNLSGFVRPNIVPGMFFAFSTKAGKTASDGEVKDYGGPYARALARWIVEPLVIETLFKRVAAQVHSETDRYQMPYGIDGLLEGAFYLGNRKPPATLPQPGPDALAEFISSNSACDYARFAEKYPNTSFTAVAKKKGEACQQDDAELEEDYTAYADYIGADFDYGIDDANLTGDETCSDRRFTGELMAPPPWRESDIGKDATDCEDAWNVGGLLLRTQESLGLGDIPQVYKGVDFGTDVGSLANDGLCNDTQFKGEGMAPEGQRLDGHVDRSDCLVAFLAGDVKLDMASAL